MGDMIDGFRELNKLTKIKRKRQKEYGIKYLEKAGIQFTAKNNGIHIIIPRGKNVINYYPSTGLFIDKANKVKKRGIKTLLNYLKENQEIKEA